MRFIGSKERLLPFIEESWRRYVGQGVFLVGDVFCGTAAVSRLFKRLGNKIVANDNLRLGYLFAQATLNISNEPLFSGLFDANEVPINNSNSLFPNPYDHVLTYLNTLKGEKGFFFREYSPGGTYRCAHERRYFSDDNACKIDSIRHKIATWKEAYLLSEGEYCLLLVDLMRATNRVANIAGTYGCFIKHWDARARKPIRLHKSHITTSPFTHDVFCKDANELVRELDFDVLYLDPPYTWRHYGAYYHILETIAHGDEPAVSGRTGIRAWEDTSSRYSYRSEASKALAELVGSANTKHIFLSYSNEGLISHEEIIDILSRRGNAICSEVNYRRYLSNNGGTKHANLKERLYYVKTQDQTKSRCGVTGSLLESTSE